MRHLRSLGLVPETGLEPVRPITGPRILSPLRLPFHHSGSSRSLSNRAPRGNAPQLALRWIWLFVDAMCGFAFQRAVTVGATVLPRLSLAIGVNFVPSLDTTITPS